MNKIKQEIEEQIKTDARAGSLVERAKKATKRRNFEITQDVIDLALAWQKDEVTITQCEKVLGVKEHNKIYAILARALKADKQPERKIEEKPTKQNIIKPTSKASNEAPSRY